MTKRNGTFHDYANALKNILRITIFNLTGSTKDLRFASPKGHAGKRMTQAVEKHQGVVHVHTHGPNSRHASLLADSVQTYLL